MSGVDVGSEVAQVQQAEAAPVMQEKMIPQSEVDRLVGAVKAKERAQIEAQYRNSGMGGMERPAIDEDALLEKAAAKMQERLERQQREFEEQRQREHIDNVAKEYLEKMKQGPQLYEDFEEVTKGFSPAKYPQVTILAGQMENTPDIIYELKKNPQKLTHLHVLALTDLEEAQAEITRLSRSIKRNEEALARNTQSPKPLSKLKSSVQAGQDTGKRTVSDLRKDSRFRV